VRFNRGGSESANSEAVVAVRGGSDMGTARPQERPAGAGDGRDGELAATSLVA
jgi:hypothetical protein